MSCNYNAMKTSIIVLADKIRFNGSMASVKLACIENKIVNKRKKNTAERLNFWQ